MASYTVYLRERHPDKDRRNARDALSLLRSANVDLDVRRGPNAANQVASLIGRSVHALRLPQIFHGQMHVGGVGPLKKCLLVQGPREREAVEAFDRRERVKVLDAGMEIDEIIADRAERDRDHALQRAEQAEAVRSAALRRLEETKGKLRAEELALERRNDPEDSEANTPVSK
jgi:hypothetical protein